MAGYSILAKYDIILPWIATPPNAAIHTPKNIFPSEYIFPNYIHISYSYIPYMMLHLSPQIGAFICNESLIT